jgi:hypothetical protein
VFIDFKFFCDLIASNAVLFAAPKSINIISDTTHGTSHNTAKKKAKCTHNDCSGKDNRYTSFCDSCSSSFCVLHKKQGMFWMLQKI